MSSQILNATLVAAPKQRNTNTEKAALRAGCISEDRQDKSAKRSHKGHAHWTMKFIKTKWQNDGTMPSSDLAIPLFGYKSYVSLDWKCRLIRKWKTMGAAISEGARLREGLLDRTNTASTG